MLSDTEGREGEDDKEGEALLEEEGVRGKGAATDIEIISRDVI